MRTQPILAINPQMVSTADCCRPFVVHGLFSQDVVWLLCERLMEILSGYHGNEYLVTGNPNEPVGAQEVKTTPPSEFAMK